jgi:two-component sensor histidine kinase
MSFYQKHDRKESMLLSMFYAYIFMLTVFSIISFWVGQYQDIVINLVTIILSLVILKRYLGGKSLKVTAVWILIVMEIHSGIMIASNHSNNVSIIFPFIFIAPFFFFFTMKEALIATLIQFVYWGIVGSIAMTLHPEFHILVSIVSLLDNMLVTFIILFIGIFYQLITESSYKKLQVANNEKDKLLEVIHHKIRNNLNFVSSLLGLQIRHIQKHPEQDDINILKNARGRIQSIALSHRALYMARDVVHIDSYRYIQNLFTLVNEIYKRDVKFICHTNNIFFLEEMTHNIGLILNELIHQSLQESDKKREIFIELSQKNDKYLLLYHDRDTSVKLQKEKFSYKLIKLIIEQMDADIELLVDDGVFYKVWFSL